LNCKEGDLAVQVSCPFYPKNVGSFYTVIEPCNCHRGAWYVEPLQDVIENVGLMDQHGVLCPAGSWCCEWDRELRPIRKSPPGKTTIQPKELETHE
jgi:hypothetical protein